MRPISDPDQRFYQAELLIVRRLYKNNHKTNNIFAITRIFVFLSKSTLALVTISNNILTLPCEELLQQESFLDITCLVSSFKNIKRIGEKFIF